MKHIFFYVCGGFVAVGLAGWALYMVWESLAQVFRDWRLGHELDQLQAESASRREQRRLSNEKRLANGCAHDFSGNAPGLPAGTCPKCGLEHDKPTGGCDHVWRVKPGPAPSSVCEKCDKIFNPLEPASLPDRK